MPDFENSGLIDGKTVAGETIQVPLAEEILEVSRRTVETSVVRVRVETHTRDQQVDESVTHHRVEVTRVPIDRYVDAVPSIREEDDVTIVPVIDEILVVERRLLLREEVRIRKVRITEQHIETVQLRAQEAVITRDPIAVNTQQTEMKKECEQ